MRSMRFFLPGLKLKRWIFVFAIGLIFILFSVITFISLSILPEIATIIGYLTYYTRPFEFLWVNTVFLLIGLGLVYISLKRMYELAGNSFRSMLKERTLKLGPKIVVIGGGTGLSSLLRGIKHYSSNITAIVTVADDGGSSGRIRDDLGILPPGDIRNCLVALADTEVLLEQLFQYRFTSDSELGGHNFGNLFIAALTEITGDFKRAITESSRVLAVRGNVFPVTLEPIALCAEFNDGTKVKGESEIPKSRKAINKVFLEPSDIKPTNEAILAIQEADIIILGPGSLYTSIIPNLLVPGISKEIKASQGLKLYICNVMTQPGETEEFTAFDHVDALIQHAGMGLFDYVFLNNRPIPKHLQEKYALEGAIPVVADIGRIQAFGLSVHLGDFVNITQVVRHNSKKLGEHIINFYKKTYLKRLINRLFA